MSEVEKGYLRTRTRTEGFPSTQMHQVAAYLEIEF